MSKFKGWDNQNLENKRKEKGERKKEKNEKERELKKRKLSGKSNDELEGSVDTVMTPREEFETKKALEESQAEFWRDEYKKQFPDNLTPGEISFVRLTGGLFDSSDFDDDTIDRGYAVIDFISAQ